MSSKSGVKVRQTFVISHWIRSFECSRSKFISNRWVSDLTTLVLEYSKSVIRFTEKWFNKSQLNTLHSYNQVKFNETGDIVTLEPSKAHLTFLVPTDILIDFKNPLFNTKNVFLKFTKLDNSSNYCNFGFLEVNQATKVPEIKVLNEYLNGGKNRGCGVYFNNSGGAGASTFSNSLEMCDTLKQFYSRKIPNRSKKNEMKRVLSKNDTVVYKINYSTHITQLFVNGKSFGQIYKFKHSLILPCVDLRINKELKSKLEIKVELTEE